MNAIYCPFAIGLILSVGCTQESASVVFPDVIEPIEEMKASAPEGTASNPYPEEFNLITEDEESYAWGHLRGYLHTDMAQAWAAIRSDLVYVNHRSVTEYSVEEQNSEEYDYVFLVHNFVEDLVDVEFDIEWRHAAVDGTTDAPERVAIRWQKIEGTQFIEMLEGSVQILAVPDGRKDVVEIQVIQHMTATLDQEENIIQYLSDLYERWQLVVHGEDIPIYEE